MALQTSFICDFEIGSNNKQSQSQSMPDSSAYATDGSTGFLLVDVQTVFARVLPLIPLYDIKEGDILKTEVRIGRRTVPATFRED